MDNPRKGIKNKILENSESDRKDADEFIKHLKSFVKAASGVSGEEFAKLMVSASKLVESKSRSNEILAKIFSEELKSGDKEESPLNPEDIYSDFERKEEVEID